ncbi:transposase [Sphingobium indicum BiD32]|uniref:Transposase n=1 Tax=Sphingobium indicum BiD32 TaxID=1301087 RepID=N1MM92_9SPHN|nr:transposase [Sphingobium indicum BiD32]
MFKILILQAQHNLSDARMEYMIRERLSWMRFLGFALGDLLRDDQGSHPDCRPAAIAPPTRTASGISATG